MHMLSPLCMHMLSPLCMQMLSPLCMHPTHVVVCAYLFVWVQVSSPRVYGGLAMPSSYAYAYAYTCVHIPMHR